MKKFMSLRVVDFSMVVALLASLVGCPLTTGCVNGAKFSPEQIKSVQDLTEVVNKAARDNNVTAFVHARLGPLRAKLVEGIELEGVEADIYITANPAANNCPNDNP